MMHLIVGYFLLKSGAKAFSTSDGDLNIKWAFYEELNVPYIFHKPFMDALNALIEEGVLVVSDDQTVLKFANNTLTGQRQKVRMQRNAVVRMARKRLLNKLGGYNRTEMIELSLKLYSAFMEELQRAPKKNVHPYKPQVLVYNHSRSVAPIFLARVLERAGVEDCVEVKAALTILQLLNVVRRVDRSRWAVAPRCQAYVATRGVDAAFRLALQSMD